MIPWAVNRIEYEKNCMSDEASATPPIPMFKRVLVTTDLSELSNQAIPYAYAMLQTGGMVRIVHVEQPFEFANPIHAPHSTTVQRVEEERARQITKCQNQLRALTPAEAESLGIVTEVEVLHGAKPAAAICNAAERLGADLICLASHGLFWPRGSHSWFGGPCGHGPHSDTSTANPFCFSIGTTV